MMISTLSLALTRPAHKLSTYAANSSEPPVVADYINNYFRKADGSSFTEDTTPIALADLSSDDFEIGYTGIYNVSVILLWGVDIGDTGIEQASA